MSYFSRLTDIVTFNLSDILESEADPQGAVAGIIAEMEEGLAAAERVVKTAQTNEDRLRTELGSHELQIGTWTQRAKDALAGGREDGARDALVRKREVEALVAGLTREHEAAVSNREQLLTTQRAIEARLADAVRKQQQLISGGKEATDELAEPATPTTTVTADEIEAELESLRRELLQ